MNELIYQALVKWSPVIGNPWCVTCQRPMKKEGCKFSCRRCRSHATREPRRRGAVSRVSDSTIIKAITAERTLQSVAREFRVSERRVGRLRKTISLSCRCGKEAHHTRACRPVYPYGATHELVQMVNEAVPRSLPEDIRGDVCQEMILAMLDGEVNVLDRAQEFIRAHRKEYAFRFGPMSIDGNERLRASL